MAYASFVHLPLWRDRPPSQAFFDFNRYEYRLQLCPASRPGRYCGQQMPGNICYLQSFRDGDFRRDEGLELCAIYTGADYIVGQIVGHEDPSGRPAWILIWDAGLHQGLAGKSNARVFRWRFRRTVLGSIVSSAPGNCVGRFVLPPGHAVYHMRARVDADLLLWDLSQGSSQCFFEIREVDEDW